jgi:predicted RNA binding protein YcfA (HicA-like mRNA interferase family)
MASKNLPVVSGQRVFTALQAAGFQWVSQKGSHVKLKGPYGHTVVVPLHPELKRGTLASILRQSGMEAWQLGL